MHSCAGAVSAPCNSLAGLRASGSVHVVMTAASIGASKGGGYARYLESKTIEPERGDYYLSPEGEPTQAPGQWLATPDTLARLGIEGSAVDGHDFIALMEGKHPRSGRFLRRAGSNGSRAAGIDLTFSAPKSVSAVWALAGETQRREIEAAHAAAVAETIGHLTETGADRAPPLPRAGDRGAGPRRGGRRVSAHDRPRRARGRRARPAAAQPCSHHQRDPRGRQDRRRRLAPGFPLGPRARRLLPLSAGGPTAAARVSGRAWHGQTWALLRDHRRATRPAGCLQRPQPRGRQSRRALPGTVRSGAGAWRAQGAQAGEPQGQDARHPQRPAASMERDRRPLRLHRPAARPALHRGHGAGGAGAA